MHIFIHTSTSVKDIYLYSILLATTFIQLMGMNGYDKIVWSTC
jgi:hypothetical protein